MNTNCPHCSAAITQHDFRCPACGKLTAKSREDLNRVDPRVSRGIGWSLIAVGLLGFAFVIANSGTSWFSGLDFVGPIALCVAGGYALSTVKK
jgi:hypothetical protein